MTKKLDERLWYNMDYGPPMHDFFLEILEPDSKYLRKTALEIKDLHYITIPYEFSTKVAYYH